MRIQPTFLETTYNCPYCHQCVQQNWYIGCIANVELDISKPVYGSAIALTDESNLNHSDGDTNRKEYREIPDLRFTSCNNCEKVTVWNNNKMIVPR